MRVILISILSIFTIASYSQNKESMVKSDSLFAGGVELYNQGKYEAAATIFKELLGIDTLIWKKERPQRMIYTGMWLGSSLYKIGKEDEAKKEYLASLYYKAVPVDHRLMVVADSLSTLAQSYTMNHDYDKAIMLFSERGRVLDSILSSDHIWAANNRFKLADIYQLKIKLALDNDLDKFNKGIFSVLDTNTAILNSEIADSLYNVYLESLSKYYGKTSFPYIIHLVTSGDFFEQSRYFKSGLWAKNVEKGLNLLQQYFPQEKDWITQSQFNLSFAIYQYALYYSNHEIDPFSDTKDEYKKKILNLDSIYTRSVFYAEDVLNKIKKESPRHPFIVTVYEHLEHVYRNRVDVACDTINIFQGIKPSFYDTSTEGLNISMDEVSDMNVHGIGEVVATALANNNKSYMSPWQNKVLQLIKDRLEWLESEDEDKKDWDRIYYALWDIIREQNNIEQYYDNIPYVQKLMAIDSTELSKTSFLSRLDIVSNVYEKVGELKKALEYQIKIYCTSDDKWVGSKKEALIKIVSLSVQLGNTSNFFNSEHLLDEFKRLENDSKVQFQKYEYDLLSSNLLSLYKNNKNPKVAQLIEYLLLKCIEINSNNGKVPYIYSLIDFYESNNYKDKVVKCRYELFDIKAKSILRNFLLANTSLRSKLWEYERNSILDIIKFNMGDTLYAPLIYNIALLTKGTLLTQDLAVKEAFKRYKTEDPEFAKLFEQWQNSYDDEDINITIERKLLAKSSELQYNNFLMTKWKDISAKLNKNDIAIEFILIPSENEDKSSHYYASIIKQTSENPVVVHLFDSNELSKIKKYYSEKKLSIKIWGRISKYIENVENIYFSADGELHNIAIEQLPHWEKNGYMSTYYNLYRLSSTRTLVENIPTSIKTAVLFGGLSFDTKPLVEVNITPTQSIRLLSKYAVADSLNLRNGVNYLPGTLEEVVMINKSLSQARISTTLYTDTVGTELNFKNLSNKGINLIHISTHGFFWKKSESPNLDNLPFISKGRITYTGFGEDKAMTRSGLLFTGANHALKGERIPEGVEDGILTAQEIASLDLRNLDLVILSACQTGLGEITGDGVFGLQRGFKKAGANSILMSLWKVDDDATRLLMTQFYENLISGKSKLESFQAAQRYVREYVIEIEVVNNDDGRRPLPAYKRVQAQKQKTEKVIKKIKPYQDPKYWAAFILLDAID